MSRLLWVNQGWRDSTELARVGDKVLIEYYMNDTSALRVVDASKWDSNEGYIIGRSMSYASIPYYWVKAIVDAGTKWLEFEPQQMSWERQADARRRYDKLVNKARIELGQEPRPPMFPGEVEDDDE
jgi:hypothetical protein